MTEPLIPTGREFDDGELPTSVRTVRHTEAGKDVGEVHTAVHDFVITVSKQVDERCGGRP